MERKIRDVSRISRLSFRVSRSRMDTSVLILLPSACLASFPARARRKRKSTVRVSLSRSTTHADGKSEECRTSHHRRFSLSTELTELNQLSAVNVKKNSLYDNTSSCQRDERDKGKGMIKGSAENPNASSQRF